MEKKGNEWEVTEKGRRCSMRLFFSQRIEEVMGIRGRNGGGRRSQLGRVHHGLHQGGLAKVVLEYKFCGGGFLEYSEAPDLSVLCHLCKTKHFVIGLQYLIFCLPGLPSSKISPT